MPKKNNETMDNEAEVNETPQPEAQEAKPERKGRKPGPARQTLLDAAEGKETVLRFDTAELAKGAAYGWWGSRRRAGLTERVAISLNTTEKTVTIGPRLPGQSEALEAATETEETDSQAEPGEEQPKDTESKAEPEDGEGEPVPEAAHEDA